MKIATYEIDGINGRGTREVPITFQFQRARKFVEGLAVAKLDGKWGYINSAGKFIIPNKYNGCTDFYKGLALVSESGQEYTITAT